MGRAPVSARALRRTAAARSARDAAAACRRGLRGSRHNESLQAILPGRGQPGLRAS